MVTIDPNDFIFSLISALLGKVVTSDEYEVSDPVSRLDQYNTEVILRPKLRGPYYVKHSLRYNRIDITKHSPVYVDRGNAVRVSDLLPLLNTLFDFSSHIRVSYLNQSVNFTIPPLQAVDIIDSTLPALSQNSTYLLLNPNSYLFIGTALLRIVIPVVTLQPISKPDIVSIEGIDVPLTNPRILSLEGVLFSVNVPNTFFTSSIYGLLVEDSLRAGISTIIAGSILETIKDSILSVNNTTIIEGSLVETIVYKSVNVQNEINTDLGIGLSSIESGEIRETIVYKSVSQSEVNRLNISTTLIESGSLEEKITYVTSTLPEPNQLTTNLATIESGTLV